MADFLDRTTSQDWKPRPPELILSGRKAGRTMTMQMMEAYGRSPTLRFALAMARAMERKLGLNRHKGDRASWATCDPAELLGRTYEELDELLAAIAAGRPVEEVLAEAADVANMAMMTADAYIHETSNGRQSVVDIAPSEWTEVR